MSKAISLSCKKKKEEWKSGGKANNRTIKANIHIRMDKAWGATKPKTS